MHSRRGRNAYDLRATVQQELSCGSVKAVSATYDRCMDQLAAATCPVLFPVDPQTGGPTLRLPADCMSVVLTREFGGDAPLVELPIPMPRQ